MIVIPNPTNESIQLSIYILKYFRRFKQSWYQYNTKIYHCFKELFSVGFIKKKFCKICSAIFICQGARKPIRAIFSKLGRLK